jgi:hypothetical protein
MPNPWDEELIPRRQGNRPPLPLTPGGPRWIWAPRAYVECPGAVPRICPLSPLAPTEHGPVRAPRAQRVEDHSPRLIDPEHARSAVEPDGLGGGQSIGRRGGGQSIGHPARSAPPSAPIRGPYFPGLACDSKLPWLLPRARIWTWLPLMGLWGRSETSLDPSHARIGSCPGWDLVCWRTREVVRNRTVLG